MKDYFVGAWPPVLALRPMAETEWMTADDAREAYTKLVDLNGNKACAVDVKRVGRPGAKWYRLLFTKPTDREPYGLERLGEDGPLMPAYVALDPKIEAHFAKSPVNYFPEGWDK